MSTQRSLADYLSLDYPFEAIADPNGGYVIVFPDLPGCMTQVETIDEIGLMAAEIKELWIETEYEQGNAIPLPSYPEEYSGKFNLRLPKSLHRRLAVGAARDEVSLNQFAVSLLSAANSGADVAMAIRALVDGQARLRDDLTRLSTQLEAIQSQLATSNIESDPQRGRDARRVA
ncbi:MAG TPA: type II toxin-antitoxin system HicB family antitoxin [Thermomicrobiales bacterium]|nr:type II toxin-antitoxin system HicB family antitoxin [Thermomicrobiales bacterium]